jgi:hypothetical protein
MYEIVDYITSRIERRVGVNNIGWENFRHSLSTSLFFRAMAVFGFGAIFIGTELLAILAAIFIAKFNILENVLLVLAIMSTILTTILLISTAIRRFQKTSKIEYQPSTLSEP